MIKNTNKDHVSDIHADIKIMTIKCNIRNFFTFSPSVNARSQFREQCYRLDFTRIFTDLLQLLNRSNKNWRDWSFDLHSVFYQNKPYVSVFCNFKHFSKKLF